MSAEQFDKHLFNLSQRAADDSAMPFNEEAWQRMEQLLDGDKKKRRFVLWWWLLPLLLVGGTAMYLHHNSASNNTIASSNIKDKEEETITKTITPKTVEEVAVDNKNISNNNDKIEVKADKLPIIVAKEGVTNTIEKSPSKPKSFIKSSANSINKNTAQIDISNANQTTLVNTNEPEKQQITQSTSANDAGNIVASTNNNSGKEVLVNAVETTKANDTIEVLKVPDTTTKTTITINKIQPKKKSSFLSKFELIAFAAADITSTNVSLKDPKSLTFGIGLSYQITKKLSIATGFGVSRKLYTADSVDYKNQPWVVAAYKLKTVDANCLVYELPINLQYQFAQSKKSSWLAVGGISTYFMKNEVYDYNYTWYNQPRKTTYTIEDKNNHLFSILNLAVGYRRQLNKQLSYQLAPFVKIPLTGIGEGKVNLYSAGLQLSVNLKGK